MTTYDVMPFANDPEGPGRATGAVGSNPVVPYGVNSVGVDPRSSFGVLVAWWNGWHAPIVNGQLWPRGGLE